MNSAHPPNIVLFTTDQHRGDFIGLARPGEVETPNLDGIAAEGAYFPRAYSEIPSTTGARRILLSGRGSHDCGVVGYSMAEWDERFSVATLLARAGYHCINVGWRNLHPRRKLYGFHTVVPHDLRDPDDEYRIWLRSEIGEYANEFSTGVDKNGWLARPWALEERLHSTNWTVDESLRQLEKRDPTRPFFLWCSQLRPHSPYDPPGFFWDLYIDRPPVAPPVGGWAERYAGEGPASRTAWAGKLDGAATHRMRSAYKGSISHIDYQMGHLIEELQERRLWENTLFIFISDHGDMLGDHHLHRKCYAYEGSARIPLVVRYPRGCELETGTFDRVAGIQDVAPTILEFAGEPVPEWMTGRSLGEAIRGEEWREYIHGEHSPAYALEHGMHYLTDGRTKYIWYAVTGEEQLFDLVTDPEECDDLASRSAESRRLDLWRGRLIELLSGRGDGFSDGTRLIAKSEWYGPDVEVEVEVDIDAGDEP